MPRSLGEGQESWEEHVVEVLGGPDGLCPQVGLDTCRYSTGDISITVTVLNLYIYNVLQVNISITVLSLYIYTGGIYSLT